MIKHIWTVVCQETKIDASTNNVSMIDAYESLQFSINTEDPNYKKGTSIAIPFHFEVVSLFFRDSITENADLEELVDILDPKGKKLAEVVSPVQFKAKSDRMRNIMKFENMALTVSGTYLFQVFTQKKEQNKRQLVSAIPINVTVEVNDKTV